MFALARMAGGTGLGFAWIRRFGAFVSGVGRGSGVVMMLGTVSVTVLHRFIERECVGVGIEKK